MEDGEAAESETAHLTSGKDLAPPPSASCPLPSSLRLALSIVASLIIASVGVSVLGPKLFCYSESSTSPAWSSSALEQGGRGGSVPASSVGVVVSLKENSADCILFVYANKIQQDVRANVSAVSPPTVPNSDAESKYRKIVDIGARNYTKLARLEAGLQMARMAIRDVKNSNRTVPSGLMHWNAKAFHRDLKPSTPARIWTSKWSLIDEAMMNEEDDNLVAFTSLRVSDQLANACEELVIGMENPFEN